MTTWIIPKPLDGDRLDTWIIVDNTLYYNDNSTLDTIYDDVHSGNYISVNVLSIYGRMVTVSKHIAFENLDMTTYFEFSIPVWLVATALAPEILPELLQVLSSISVGLSYDYNVRMLQIIMYNNSYNIGVLYV